MADFSSDVLLSAKVEIRVDDGKLRADLARAKRDVQNITDKMTKHSISKMKDKVTAGMRTEKLGHQQTLHNIQANITATGLKNRIADKASKAQRKIVQATMSREKQHAVAIQMDAKRTITAQKKVAQTAKREEREAARMQNEAAHRISRMSSAFRMLGVQVAIVGAVITAVFGTMLSDFAKFESSMRKGTAVTTFSLGQYTKMSAMAEQASVKLNVTASDAADAFYFLGSAGLSAGDQMKAFIPVVTLAKAAMIESGQAAEIMVNTMMGFKLPFKETAHVADVMAKSVISSNMNFLQLGETLSLVSGVARTTNNTVEETAAMIQLMANVGIKGTRAGTTLRRSMLNLAAPSAKIERFFRDMSLSISDQTGKIKPYIRLLGEISDRLRHATEAQKMMAFKTLFGARAIAGQLELFDAGSIALAEMVLQLQLAGGTIQEIADKQLAAFSEQLGIMHKTAQNLGRHLASNFVPTLRNTTDLLTKATDKLTKVSDGFMTLSAIIVGTGIAMGGILTIGGSLLTTMASLALVSQGLRMGFLSLLGIAGGVTLGILALVAIVTTAIVVFVRAKGKQRKLNEEIKSNREFVKKATTSYEEFIKVLDSKKLTPGMVKLRNEIEGVSDEILVATRRMGVLMRMKASNQAPEKFIRRELRDRGLQMPYKKVGLNPIKVPDHKKGLELILKDEERVIEAIKKSRKKLVKDINEINKKRKDEVLGIQSRLTKESVDLVVSMFDDIKGHSAEFTAYSINQLHLRQEAERDDFVKSLIMAKDKKDALIAEFDAIQKAQKNQLTDKIKLEAAARDENYIPSESILSMFDDIKGHSAEFTKYSIIQLNLRQKAERRDFIISLTGSKTKRDALIADFDAVQEAQKEQLTNQVKLEAATRGSSFKAGFMEQTREIKRNFKTTGQAGADMAMTIQDSIGSAFERMIKEGRNFKDIMLDFANEIGNAFIRITANQMASSMMGSFSFGGVGSGTVSSGPSRTDFGLSSGPSRANLMHGGGMVGSSTGGVSRAVSSGMFNNAPRLHDGLAPDEFPAILQSGERVIKRGGNGGGSGASQPPNIVINFEDKTGSGVKPTQGKTAFDGKSFVTNIILEDSANFGPLKSQGVIG